MTPMIKNETFRLVFQVWLNPRKSYCREIFQRREQHRYQAGFYLSTREESQPGPRPRQRSDADADADVVVPTSPPRRSPFPARRVLATEQRSSLSSSPPTPALRRLHPLTSSLMAPGSSSERLDSSSTVTRRVSPSLSPTSRPSTSLSSLSFSCRRRRRRRRRRRSSSPSSSSPSSCWWCCATHSGVRRIYAKPVEFLSIGLFVSRVFPLFFSCSCCQRTLFVYVYTRKHRLSYFVSFYSAHTRVYMRTCICVCVAGSHRQVTREVNGDQTKSNEIYCGSMRRPVYRREVSGS